MVYLLLVQRIPVWLLTSMWYAKRKPFKGAIMKPTSSFQLEQSVGKLRKVIDQLNKQIKEASSEKVANETIRLKEELKTIGDTLLQIQKRENE